MVFCFGLSGECSLSTCSMISRDALPASSGGVPTATAFSAQTNIHIDVEVINGNAHRLNTMLVTYILLK